MLTIQQMLQPLMQPRFASSSSSTSNSRKRRRRFDPLEGVSVDDMKRYRACFLFGLLYLLGMLIWVVYSYQMVFEQHWSTEYPQQKSYNPQLHVQHQGLLSQHRDRLIPSSSSGLAESSVHRAVVNGPPSSGQSVNAVGNDRYSVYVRPRANRHVPGWEDLVSPRQKQYQLQVQQKRQAVGDDDYKGRDRRKRAS